MPPILPNGAPSIPDPRFDAHLAPTLADVHLAPRRRLRDGTESSGSSRRASASSRGSRTSLSRGLKRSRSISTEEGGAAPDVTANAEASRRLPPLQPRQPRERPEPEEVIESSDDEPLQRRRSRSFVQLVHSAPPPGAEDGESSQRASPTRVQQNTVVDSSDDEPLSRRRSRSSQVEQMPRRSSHDRGEEGVEEGVPHSPPQQDTSTRDLPNQSVDSHIGDTSLESALSNGSRLSQESGHTSHRSPSPASSTDTESTGPRRFTAQEKGKGRAMPRPSVVELSDDEGFDESIQFIDSKPAPPIDITDDAESMVEDELPEVAIDEESSISAFTCPVCFMAPTAPTMTPCGHIMCYGCLHQSLIAAIGRQMNPYPRDPPARGRGGRRGRPRRSAFAQLAAGGRYVPPAKWTQETLEEAWGASQDDHMRRQLVATGESPEQIEAILEAQRQERQDTITHPLEGLWGLNDGKWVIEGECPVCRKPIPGGLGPLNYRLGSVVLLETRVARAGESDVPSLALAAQV